MYGAIGEVNYLVENLKSETDTEDALVIATGGLARTIADNTDTIDIVDDELTLWGLYKIYEKNITDRQ